MFIFALEKTVAHTGTGTEFVSRKNEGLWSSVAIATAPRINHIIGSDASNFFIENSRIKKIANKEYTEITGYFKSWV